MSNKLQYNKLLHSELTDKIIRAFYKVYNKLGYGFLEKVYENALVIELLKSGFHVQQQQKVVVKYDNRIVGEYFADLIIDNKIIIELKAVETLIDEHKNQLLNYLKATDKEVGLLLNFGKKPLFKRVIFTNNPKQLNDN